jgi:hypothetical protein
VTLEPVDVRWVKPKKRWVRKAGCGRRHPAPMRSSTLPQCEKGAWTWPAS